MAWSRAFRGLRAIDGVDLAIAPGSITTIIGPNGAGKSTLFNMATGYLAPTAGEIWYEGRRIDGTPTYRLNRAGMARVFQIAKPFHGLSVYENVLVGALFGREGARDPRKVTEEALAFAQLSPLAGEVASSLPVGHLRRLEFARALATRPRLILADEPCAGLNPVETARDDGDAPGGAAGRGDGRAGRARHGDGDEDLRQGVRHRRRSVDRRGRARIIVVIVERLEKLDQVFAELVDG